MSKTYRKYHSGYYLIIKDGTIKNHVPKNKRNTRKKIFNRRIRKNIKLLPVKGNTHKKLNNSRNISDYKFGFTKYEVKDDKTIERPRRILSK